MRIKSLFSVIIVIAVVSASGAISISGCSSGAEKSKSQKVKNEASLYGTKWMIQTLNGKRVLIPEGGKEVYINIEKDGRASGSSGCNTFSGQASIEGKSVTFGPMATTRMMCPDQMDTERDFLEALKNTSSYGISGNTLSMMDAGRNVLATFTGFKAMGVPGQ